MCINMFFNAMLEPKVTFKFTITAQAKLFYELICRLPLYNIHIKDVALSSMLDRQGLIKQDI